MKWIKNTDGKPDAMLTFAFFSFTVVTLNVLLSTFGTLTVGDFEVVFTSLDSSVMGVYLGSTFTAYVSRRWTDKKYKGDEPEVSKSSAPAASLPLTPVTESLDSSIDLGST